MAYTKKQSKVRVLGQGENELDRGGLKRKYRNMLLNMLYFALMSYSTREAKALGA